MITSGAAGLGYLDENGNGWVFKVPNGGWEYPAFLTAVTVVQALLGDGVFALSNSIAQQRPGYAVAASR